MLIKPADPVSQRRVQLLQRLQRHGQLDKLQSRWVTTELARTRAGMRGEEDAAYYIDHAFADSTNNVVIHDLRLRVDDQVAQIDHLMFGRGGYIYLVETKNFSGHIHINEQGEFTVQYGSDRYGIPSPLEQSQRHETVLARLMGRLGITGRLGGSLDFQHVVLMHPQAIINRPNPKQLDTSRVMKADQFATWHRQRVDRLGVLQVLGATSQIRSLETIQGWAEALVRQHEPADPTAMPGFMLAAMRRLAEIEGTDTQAHEAAQRRNSSAPPPSPPITPAKATAPSASPAEPGAAAEPQRKLICAECQARISFAEGRFCWNNPNRFGGLQYCRAHQGAR